MTRSGYIALTIATLAVLAAQATSTYWLAKRIDHSIELAAADADHFGLRLECEEIELKWMLINSNQTHQFEYRNPATKGTACDTLLYGP